MEIRTWFVAAGYGIEPPVALEMEPGDPGGVARFIYWFCSGSHACEPRRVHGQACEPLVQSHNSNTGSPPWIDCLPRPSPGRSTRPPGFFPSQRPGRPIARRASPRGGGGTPLARHDLAPAPHGVCPRFERVSAVIRKYRPDRVRAMNESGMKLLVPWISPGIHRRTLPAPAHRGSRGPRRRDRAPRTPLPPSWTSSSPIPRASRVPPGPWNQRVLR